MKLTAAIKKLIWLSADRGVPDATLKSEYGINQATLDKIKSRVNWREFYPKREPDSINPNRLV